MNPSVLGGEKIEWVATADSPDQLRIGPLLLRQDESGNVLLHVYNDTTGLWDRMRAEDAARIIEALQGIERVLAPWRPTPRSK